MVEANFRLVKDQEIRAYLRDMVTGGGFAQFRLDFVEGNPRIYIRMKFKDLGNEVRRKCTAAAMISTLGEHGSPNAQVFVVAWNRWRKP